MLQQYLEKLPTMSSEQLAAVVFAFPIVVIGGVIVVLVAIYLARAASK